MRKRWFEILLVATCALVAVLAGAWYELDGPGRSSVPASVPCFRSSGGSFTSTNLTSSLGGSFSHGSVQAFGSNASAVIFGGIARYHRNSLPYDSLPAVEQLKVSGGATTSVNLTAELSPYFELGGVFPVAWNGSAWLLAGQTTVDGASEGAAVAIQNGRLTNLTPLIGPYFAGEGVWIGGWDGTGWLLGGNSTAGATLIYLQGDQVTDLTPLLPNNQPNDWVQMVDWNGSGWSIGGQGVLGLWYHGAYQDLLPLSPFAGGGGVFAMDWDGSAWWVAGTPAGLYRVEGSRLVTGPPLPAAFNAWVNTIVPTPLGLLVGGGGYTPTGGYSTELALVYLGGSVSSEDLSACLPGAFLGGWIQFGGPAPAFSDHSFLFVGEGGTAPLTFESHAAVLKIDYSTAG